MVLGNILLFSRCSLLTSCLQQLETGPDFNNKFNPAVQNAKV
jgi:hypothetical protein